MAIDDLNNFENTLAANDIYRQLGGAISKSPIDTRSMNPLAGFGTAVAQSFLASALGQWGKENEAKQLATVANVLPQLYADPKNVMVPEGVDAEAFGALKNSALRTEALRKQDYETKAIESLFSRRPDIASRVLGLDEGKRQGAPESTAVATPTIESVLAQGRETTNQKIIRLTKEQLDADPRMTPTQAQQAARAQVQDEIKANTGSVDKAQEARRAGQTLLDLANTAKAGMSAAGSTGPLNPVAHAADWAMSIFGNDNAATRVAGDTTLNSIRPELIKAVRSPGAVSDFESSMYIKSGPSTSNTPEANAVLAQKMEDLGKLNLDYADFLEAYKQQNSGSISGADKIWSEYRQAFPIFKTDKAGTPLALNSDRPSWQEFVVQRQAAKEGLVGDAGTAPNMASFISQAKASGMSKEQAREAWSKLNGR